MSPRGRQGQNPDWTPRKEGLFGICMSFHMKHEMRVMCRADGPLCHVDLHAGSGRNGLARATGTPIVFMRTVTRHRLDEMARHNPKWRFLTLTKFPQRANEFEFPDNVWMGTTVDAQSRVANAEAAFETIRCKTKWLSVEPLLQPLHFEHLDRFQWIVIGGASRSEKTPEWVPPFDWVADLQRDARAAGCKVYHKTNLALGDAIRVREFPWTETRPHALPKSFRYLKGL